MLEITRDSDVVASLTANWGGVGSLSHFGREEAVLLNVEGSWHGPERVRICGSSRYGDRSTCALLAESEKTFPELAERVCRPVDMFCPPALCNVEDCLILGVAGMRYW